jgi:putative GTP pyrophosphokinase
MELPEEIKTEDLDLTTFLSRSRIDKTTWDTAKMDWETLHKIGIDHQSQTDSLSGMAAMYANSFQKFEKVHSVRWRVKHAEHLMEKIVRKRANAEEKYMDISPENYYKVVTDLVGIRAIHLFKDDCFDIDSKIRSTWDPVETPIAYVREGDPDDFKKRLHEAKFETKDHPAGYRSVHYVVSSRPIAREVFTEIQVRTIFEEGWSEIDHSIRYPNFSDNQLVGVFLAIFNRLAGSADEMGAFVKGLINAFDQQDQELMQAQADKKSALAEMEKTLEQFEKLKQQDEKSKALVASLKSELSKLNTSEEALSPTISDDKLQIGNAIARHRLTSLSDIFDAEKARQKKIVLRFKPQK